MTFPVLFIWFLIAIFLFRHHMKKDTKLNERASQTFWKKEQASLVVRKQSLNEEDYVKPSLDPIYFMDEAYYLEHHKPELLRYQTQIEGLLKEPMVNLSHMSNTDVRLTYGTAMITTIEAYETNYNHYIKALYALGKGFYELGNQPLAKAYLEEGIHVGTDIKSHFMLLAEIYLNEKEPSKINDLIEKAQNLHSLTKNSLVHTLQDLLNTNDHTV